MLGSVYYRAGDHQHGAAVPGRRRQEAAQMKSKDDFFDVIEVMPGEDVMRRCARPACTMPAVT